MLRVLWRAWCACTKGGVLPTRLALWPHLNRSTAPLGSAPRSQRRKSVRKFASTPSGIIPTPLYDPSLTCGMPQTNTGSVAEWFKALVLKTSVRGTVPWVRIPPLPPLAHRKPEMSSLTGPFFFLFQRGLARPSDFRRLTFPPKSVSERLASLSIRPSPKSRRILKMSHFHSVGGKKLRRS
jgi:hypothetical protein